jgi:hypothetical protein
LWMGIYGIRVKKKMMVGKRARKKVKERDEALLFIDPRVIPLKKKTATSYMGKPSNPGIIILLVNLLIHTKGFNEVLFFSASTLLVYFMALRLMSRLLI